MITINRVAWFRSHYGFLGAAALALGIGASGRTAWAAPNFPNYPNFTSTAGLNLVGTSTQFGNRVRLTAATTHQAGGLWLADKQKVADGFRTSFAFEVSEPDSNFGADGFAFLVQNVSATALGSSGSSLAFMDIGEGPGLNNYLAVEFDTHNSGVTFDTNGNHIAVQSKGPSSSRVFLGSANPPFSIQSGGVHTAQITYEPGTLTVAVDGSATPLLQVSVDLNSLLELSDGHAWVGFTAATGAAWENHDILSWSFRPIPEPSSYLLLTVAAAVMMLRRFRIRNERFNRLIILHMLLERPGNQSSNRPSNACPVS